MEFGSLAFLFFLVITLVLYWGGPKKLQWLVLLLASGYFYFSWQPAYGVVIFISMLVSYVCVRLMDGKIRKSSKITVSFKNRFLLLIGVGTNLGLLFLFKYFNFFSLTLTELSAIKLPHLELLLPLGISFYTFQMVGYLFDVYQAKITPEKHLGKFAVFVLFFPKLIAGPIEQSKHFLPQAQQEHVWDAGRFKSGLKLFAFGLFKKLVIADNLARVVDQVFGSIDQYRGLSLILIIFIYSWQILADFSGYTDMARGVARMFGYNLMENFNTPYFATSLRDFWRRWHISLSTWLREYLYIPLGGSRVSLWRVCLNYIIVFVVCGIWHGATWNFILWGALHGIVIAGERLAESVAHNVLKIKITVPKIISYAYTYAVVCISWVLFRAVDLQAALYIYKNMLAGAKNFISPTYIQATIIQLFQSNQLEMAIVLFALISIIMIEAISSNYPIGSILKKQPFAARLVVYVSVVCCIILFRNVGVTEFIYTRF